MNSNCSECVHANICRYVVEFEKLVKEAETLKENSNSFFSLSVTCRFFRSDAGLTAARLINKRTLNEYYDIIAQSPCTKCPSKPDLSKGPQIGDTACDWCSHNPFRVNNR